MVISETIICQRFIQNAWKKDLCSNCFKSKEDHAVIPEKKITYRWTSHVNNFPHHGILKDRQKNGKEKPRTVSFHLEESEVIGFGGEEYSSDDDDYPVYHENGTSETDNEEEDKEFRKLTKSNTDFNSIAANLKNDKCAGDVHIGRNSYSDLKFGMPVVDAEGRRQTLQVTIEPFKNSVIVNGVCNNDGKLHTNKTLVNNYVRNDKTDKNNENKKNTNRSHETGAAAQDGCDSAKNKGCILSVTDGNDCSEVAEKENSTMNRGNSLGDLSTGCDNSNKVANANKISDEPKNVLSVNLKEAEKDTSNVFVKGVPDVTEDSKYTKVSNILVDGLLNAESVADVADPHLNLVSETKSNQDDSSIIDSHSKSQYRSFSDLENSNFPEKEKRPCSMSKDCNPINLPPLMVCKPLDIEFDSPGSREMVGEPDGKADSDDSCDPVPSSIIHGTSATAAPSALLTLKTTAAAAPIIDSSIYVNPQRSFLHDLSDGKPKQNNTKPVTGAAATAEATAVVVAATNETPKKANVCKESSDSMTMNGLTCTPKIQIPITCNGTGSVKRQAPKPPSPKIIAPSPLFTAPVHLEDIVSPVSTPSNTLERPTSKCESPLVSGQRDAISFLAGDQSMNNTRRKLNLDTIAPPSRNSLSMCISASPSGTDSMRRHSTLTGAAELTCLTRKDSDTSSICSMERRSPSKCSRSLSCDSIISPSVVAALPEKTRKYSNATIKVKSKIRKLLRFNNKEDEKFEPDVNLPVTPRKRIEIIHPLDLNTSTIEILGSNAPNLVNDDTEAKKKTENENGDSNGLYPAISATHSTCPLGRPTKPPPPPRAQSLDQKYSEISRPVRPPPPKCGTLKLSQSPLPNAAKMSNLYENIGQSRNGMAPAKPQRAASIRERTRQIASVTSVEESFASLVPDRETVPECDQNSQQLSDVSDLSAAVSSVSYCGGESESDIYDSFNTFKNNSDRKSKGVMHKSLEDNYGAVVVANHEALSQLFERVNQATLVPNSLKVLQTTLHIRFEHLTLDMGSRIVVADWHFFNASWNNQNVVVSLSTRYLGSMRSLPSSITLYSLVKFNDMIPSRIFNGDASEEMKTNAYITIWNEERVESIDSFCSNANTNFPNKCGLFLTQLANALLHLQNSEVNTVSLDEIFICKRETLVEPKLLLLPFNVDSISPTTKDNGRNKITLCSCVSMMADRLLPEQLVTRAIMCVTNEGSSNALSQIKAVIEYWLWGPCGTTITGDRMTSLQRWLDLERANCLHKMICKSPSELSLQETCHMMFLVRTNAKTLTEASFVFEKQS